LNKDWLHLYRVYSILFLTRPGIEIFQCTGTREMMRTPQKGSIGS